MGAVGYRVLGSGPPLVMIMGYGGTMEAWDPRFVDALSQHHRVVIFDNAGVGDTAPLPTPLTVDAMASQTSALIDTLGLHRPDVLGWSMGGMIAQALAVEHPSQVGRLVLCATFPGVGTVKPSQAAIDDLKSTNSTKVMSVLFPSDQSAAKESFGIATGDYPPSSPAPKAAGSAQKHAVDAWFDGLDDAGRQTSRIAVPTLIADGTVDRLDPVSNDHVLASLIAKSKLVLYPDAGHAFLFQEEGTFVPVVESFLSGN
jgi:pimeloyl-ACP methyl ester carboxylesterase